MDGGFDAVRGDQIKRYRQERRYPPRPTNDRQSGSSSYDDNLQHRVSEDKQSPDDEADYTSGEEYSGHLPSGASRVPGVVPGPVREDQWISSDAPFIHRVMLPVLNVTLNEALVVDLPPCSSPLDYIRADANHVNNIVQKILTLTRNDEIYHTSFAGNDMIYRRLVVYVFAHLMLCASDEGLLSRLKTTLQQWKTWDNITVLQNHQLIKDYLWDIFRRGLMESSPTLHSEEAFRKLAVLDAFGLSAQLTFAVTNNNTYKQVVALRDLGAQSVLNLLQAHLDFSLDPMRKPRHVKALLRLSRKSGLYPECFTLTGIKMEPHPVAGGGYGEVYKGLLHEKQIAVKVLKVYQDSDLVQLLKEFSSEAVLWRQLSHPNVLPFYGVYRLDQASLNLCLTAPWMENGNVIDFLKRYPVTYCVNLALDIALGLEHLHSLNPSIVHGDLKGANVLITHSGRACLADFGLATAIDSRTVSIAHSSSVSKRGTVRWQAPELHDPDVYQPNSKASDIYAFACVCYELFSGHVPFYEKKGPDSVVLLSVLQGRRPVRPSHDLSTSRGLGDEVWNIVVTCWAQDPTKRPTAEQVVERLQVLSNRRVDRRPLDNISTNLLPPQTLYKHSDNPFSAIATANQIPLVPRLDNSHKFGRKVDIYAETSSRPLQGVVGQNLTGRRIRGFFFKSLFYFYWGVALWWKMELRGVRYGESLLVMSFYDQ